MEAPVRICNVQKLRGTVRKKKSVGKSYDAQEMNGTSHDKDQASSAQSETLSAGEGTFGARLQVGLPLDFRKPSYQMQTSSSKSGRLKDCVEQSISEDSKKKVSGILADVQQLSDIEKLLLYLQLPTGTQPAVDPLKQKSPGNPLGKKADMEVAQTYTWIQSHLEEDSEVSLPKQEVYEEYRIFCMDNRIEALCAADFGKVMKYVFPSVKPRRLGTRGNSRYCYSGLRKRLQVETPTLPDLSTVPDTLQEKVTGVRSQQPSAESGVNDESYLASCYLIFEWAEKLLNKRFTHLQDLAHHLLQNTYVDSSSVAAFTLLSSSATSTSVQNGNQMKGNQASAIFRNVSGCNKRRETQLQLQRKLHEKGLIKEQKKKLQEQRSSTCKVQKGQRKQYKKEATITSSEKVKEEMDAFPGTIKLEEMEETKEMEQPQKLMRCQSENGLVFEVEHKVNKVPIMRKSSSPAVCFQQGSLPSIIILPPLSQQVQISPSDVGSRSPTKLVSHPKYKRIQPKPVSGSIGMALGKLCSPVHNNSNNETVITETSSAAFSRTFTNSPQNLASSLTTQSVELPLFAEVAAMASSPPRSSDMQIKKACASVLESGVVDRIQLGELTFDGTKAASVIVETPVQFHSKRHADEHDGGGGSSKKLHLDEINCDMSVSCSKVSLSSPKVEFASDETPSSKQEFNLSLSRVEEKNEMSIHDLESDALMEYLQGDNQVPPNVTITEELNARAFKQVGKSGAPWSQLRLLLERNLPQNATSSKLLGNPKQPSQAEPTSDAHTVEFCELSELKQVLLRDNRQSFRSKSEPNSDRESWLTDPSLPSLMNELGNQLDSSTMEKMPLLMSSHLENSLTMDNSVCSVVSYDSQTHVNRSTSEMNQGGFPPSGYQQRPVESLQCTSVCTQVPSVPPSPNTRRRAFNFMPISPGQTPSDNHSAAMSPTPPSFLTNNPMLSSTINPGSSVVSIAVGPSQPPSAASSPFVSPRSTPIPVVRSRHNSGQSLHRQTPCLTTDSGVSSISTSPFVSPQTTPIPVSRLRHNSNHSGSVGKSVTFSTGPQVSISSSQPFQCRSRHSSGPLTPSTQHGQAFLSRTPMSPLVGENYTQTSFSEPPSNPRSRHNSASSQPPASPLSNPVSPQTLTTDPLSSDAGSVYSLKQSPHVPWSSGSWGPIRNRHVSGSVIHHRPSQQNFLIPNPETLQQSTLNDSSLSLEIQNLLQSAPISLNPTSRSRSVPLHQMLRTMSDQCMASQEDALNENILAASRSYPATPLNDTPFHLPAPSGILDDPNLNSLKSQPPDWVSLDMLTPSSRRNLSNLLEGDDLQTTLEDLRDCDNDYSKFALELDQVSQESNYS